MLTARNGGRPWEYTSLSYAHSPPVVYDPVATGSRVDRQARWRQAFFAARNPTSETQGANMKLHRSLTALLTIGLVCGLSGCGSQNADAERADEDRGMAPDTTATTPNMITPSEDAETSPSASASATPREQ